ncbi:hypothetical protein F5Y00DRAFT_205712 [Daldinia vernicosa]|uniref:uncharacterized protein n=1 Tax=Daldinia vernicosa TaxID=114800 RepID=UPI002007B126|nr:uncharacterized protein F5Y00DRAFT_205712 [Daldinia vernicosa]KAI0852038.1 hypothetical protein F5Y00DRAFT_205712 [Daldinia vernicosa]
MQIRSFLIAALAAGTATAHMNMKDPPPLAYKGNPNSKDPNIDYSITSPITKEQYPCKGYLKLIGTAEGASVKTYAPGGSYSMSVEGGAYHNGGSCQLSLSYDKGSTFTVIKSFIGNCPTASGGTFNFDMPADAPEGDDVVFAWTWVNNTGNREFYMSCAIVTIKSGAAKRELPMPNMKRDTAFSSRPQMFTANLDGEYCTKEGVDTVYPEPGPDVENTSTNPGPAILCATGADAPEGGSGSGSGSGSGAGSSSSAAASTPATTSAAAQSSSAAAQPTITGGVFLTVPPSGSASATPASSTLATVVVPSSSAGTGAGASSSVVAAPPAASSPAGTPTTSAKAPTSTGGAGAGAGAQSGACTNEGAWACSADGASFQRCASGQWSAAIPMASGTKCTPGISNTFQIGRVRRDRVRRAAQI